MWHQQDRESSRGAEDWRNDIIIEIEIDSFTGTPLYQHCIDIILPTVSFAIWRIQNKGSSVSTTGRGEEGKCNVFHILQSIGIENTVINGALGCFWSRSHDPCTKSIRGRWVGEWRFGRSDSHSQMPNLFCVRLHSPVGVGIRDSTIESRVFPKHYPSCQTWLGIVVPVWSEDDESWFACEVSRWMDATSFKSKKSNLSHLRGSESTLVCILGWDWQTMNRQWSTIFSFAFDTMPIGSQHHGIFVMYKHARWPFVWRHIPSDYNNLSFKRMLLPLMTTLNIFGSWVKVLYESREEGFSFIEQSS